MGRFLSKAATSGTEFVAVINNVRAVVRVGSQSCSFAALDEVDSLLPACLALLRSDR